MELIKKIKSIEIITYDSENQIHHAYKSKYIYAFDRQGNKTEYTSLQYISDTAESTLVNYKYSYTYNSSGNKTTEIQYLADRSIKLRTTYSYDKHQSLIEFSQFSNSGKVEYNSKYKYNKLGKIVETSSSGMSDSVNNISTVKYIQKGKEQYSIEEGSNFQEIFRFDKKGTKIEHFNYYKGLLEYREEFKYDNKKLITEELIYEPDGHLRSKELTKCDKKGNRLEYIEYDSDEVVLSKTIYYYKYDKQGNWNYKSKFVDDKLIDITLRTITYY